VVGGSDEDVWFSFPQKIEKIQKREKKGRWKKMPPSSRAAIHIAHHRK
jgi:hypothetical protein